MLAIEVENVVKEFPGGWRRPPVRIIDDISFTVEKGQHVAIIGPNGCGKTTLLRTIATIYRPDAGKVRIFGQDVFNWRQSERSRRAFAFISPALAAPRATAARYQDKNRARRRSRARPPSAASRR